MADGDFPIGSVVVLKSGGPKMTVVKYDKSDADETDTFTHQCVWFVKEGRATLGGEDTFSPATETRFFPPEALKLAAE